MFDKKKMFEKNVIVNVKSEKEYNELKNYCIDNNIPIIIKYPNDDYNDKFNLYFMFKDRRKSNNLDELKFHNDKKIILTLDDIRLATYTITEIINYKIAVHCDTEEKAKQFDEYINDYSLPSSCWYIYDKNTCYDLNIYGTWTVNNISYYIKNHKIINFNQILK